jgi:hypothetical protein
VSLALPAAGEPKGISAVTLTVAFDFLASLLFPALVSFRVANC